VHPNGAWPRFRVASSLVSNEKPQKTLRSYQYLVRPVKRDFGKEWGEDFLGGGETVLSPPFGPLSHQQRGLYNGGKKKKLFSPGKVSVDAGGEGMKD